MFRSMLIAVALATVATSAAGADLTAFGIVHGRPLPSDLAVKQVDRTVRLKSVPAPYPDIRVYAATVDSAGNVCSVTGYIPAGDQDRVEGRISSIYVRMREAYGEPINARPGGQVNEMWLWFTKDQKQTITLRRYLGENFKRAASLEYLAAGIRCK